jgi:hypothetical protein
MGMQNVALDRKEFYLELKEAILIVPSTMNRTTAGNMLKGNPYWEDLEAPLQKRLLAVVETKTNWGKNLLEQALMQEFLEYLLHI